MINSSWERRTYAKLDIGGGNLPAKSLLTSKATEASLFVVLTDVWLVVPPHCGPQVLWGPDWALPDKRKENTDDANT